MRLTGSKLEQLEQLQDAFLEAARGLAELEEAAHVASTHYPLGPILSGGSARVPVSEARRKLTTYALKLDERIGEARRDERARA